MFSDIVQYLLDLAESWAALVTGGFLVAIWALWERYHSRPVSFRLYLIVFLGFGLPIASFLTWRHEHSARILAEQSLEKTSGRAAVLTVLKQFYEESDKFLRRCLNIKTAEEYDWYVIDENQFSKRLEAWVSENMGPAAKARLSRYSMAPNLQFNRAISPAHSSSVIGMMQLKENISGLIENPAWDKP